MKTNRKTKIPRVTSLLLIFLTLSIGGLWLAGTLHEKYFFKEFVGREIDSEKVLGIHGRIYTRGRRCIIIQYDNDLWEFLKADRNLEPITTRKSTVPFEFQDYLEKEGMGQPTVYGTRHIFTRNGKSELAENPFVWHVPSYKLLCIGHYYPKEGYSSGMVSAKDEPLTL